MDSQDSRWIPKIRDGFAGFAMDSQDSQDSQGFADIRKDSRIIRGRIHDKFAKIREDSRRFALVSQGSHVYAHCESENEPLDTTHGRAKVGEGGG